MINSKDNATYKHLNSLNIKKYRDKHGEFLVFGEHLISELKKSTYKYQLFTSNPKKGGLLISSELLNKINPTVTPFDQIALVKKEQLNIKSNKVLILDDVQDPANVGGLLRSALAFGFMEVIVSNKSADIYNDKTIRASQGALFALNIRRGNIIDYIKEYKNKGFDIVATSLKGNDKLSKEKIVLVLGNEGSGISEEVLSLANSFVTIKTTNVESLNVLVAGSILMYEGSKL